VEQCQEYLEDGGPFPERLHIIVPFALLFAGFFEAMLGWACQAERDIQEWPGTKDVGMTTAARRQLQEKVDDLGRVLAR
jgi:PadR family transcriptional regulator AphA